MNSKLKNNVLRVAIVLSLGSFAVVGLAATDTNNLSVSASITDNCTIDASGSLAFGAYDPIITHNAVNLDGTGTVAVTCTDQAAWAITLGQGQNADVSSTDAVPLRNLIDDNSADLLEYFLYQEVGHTNIWGNTTLVDVAGTGTGAAQSNTVYGVVTQDQQSEAGSYTDTVVATVTF